MERAGRIWPIGKAFCVDASWKDRFERVTTRVNKQAAASLPPPLLLLSGMEAERPRPKLGLVHDSPPGQLSARALPINFTHYGELILILLGLKHRLVCAHQAKQRSAFSDQFMTVPGLGGLDWQWTPSQVRDLGRVLINGHRLNRCRAHPLDP